MDSLNQCQKANEQLEEAIELLKEWKEFAYQAIPPGHIAHFDFLGRKRLTEKTDTFLYEKEGMNG